MDLTETIIPKSDQLNAEDMLAGPLTVTVESVGRGNAEQPVDFHLVEYPGRAYRPSKTMRRVIVKAWGKESDAYTGRRMTLYRDPEVKFGGQKIGGIKISHLSHIDRAFSLALTETRGKRAVHTVEPLTQAAPQPTPAPAPTPPGQITRDQLSALGRVLAAANLDDKDEALATLTEIVGRPVEGTRDLSSFEAQTVLDTLTAITPAARGGVA